MRRIIGFAIALAITWLAPAVSADETGRHSCPAHWSEAVSRNAGVTYRLADIWDPFHAPLIEQGGVVAFTDQPGMFLTINCTRGRLTPTETQEFYPIGLIVKPLRVLTLSDDQVDVFFNPRTGIEVEVPRTYLLVLTEYGHLKVIRERDIQYMISGATYFFASGGDFIYLCDDAADCPGNARRFALPNQESRAVCDRSQCRESTAIAAMGGYAVGGIPRFEAGVPQTDWSHVVSARERLRADPDLADDPAAVAAYCRPFRVKAFERGGVVRLTSAEDEFLTLCRDRAAAIRATLRDIDKARALRIFDDIAQGLFFRRFGSAGTTLVSVMNPASSATELGQKECGEKVSTEISTNLKAGGGWRIPFGIFDFGSEMEVARSSSIERLISEDEYVRFSNFVAPDIYETPFAPVLEAPQVHNLVFIIACESRVVDKPRSVALDYPAFSEGRMEVGVQALTNTYYAKNRSPDAVEPGAPGHEPNTSPDLIKAGRFFTIRGAADYFRWRETVRAHLREETNLRDVLRDLEDDPRRHDIVLDFFTHLFMAALFDYAIATEPPRAEEF
jgi:hypothetical protein